MHATDTLYTRQYETDRFRAETDPVLQLEKINVSFDGFQALTDLTLSTASANCAALSAPTARAKPR